MVENGVWGEFKVLSAGGEGELEGEAMDAQRVYRTLTVDAKARSDEM